MKIAELMTKDVWTCSPLDSLERVARIMWDHDIGAVAVVDESGRTTGMITDRDVAMAAYTQGKPLSEIPVWIAASNTVIAARPHDTVDTLHERMRAGSVRRVPVVGAQGEPVGIVSLGDVARRFVTVRATDGMSADSIAHTLAAISQPRTKPFEGSVYRVQVHDGSWDVYDRSGARMAAGLRTQADAVTYAKDLARRDGSAEIIVYDDRNRIASELFCQSDDSSLAV